MRATGKCIREHVFTWWFSVYGLNWCDICLRRASAISTTSQPKSIAVSADSTVFVAEISSVEVIRSNQRVFELQTKYAPASISASGDLVAVGGEVRVSISLLYYLRNNFSAGSEGSS